MKKIAAEYEARIEDIDENLQINIPEKFELNFHPDDRGFAYMTCKIHDETLLSTLEDYFTPYTK
ncbi:MAG: hypothetical protein ACXAEU_12725 [Candidatus Hodarchaeales archaeon]|jgi:hypothetical protein